jgi:hypothetical protein
LETMLRSTLMWRIENAELRPAIEVAKQLPGSAWSEANSAADKAIHGWIAMIHHASSAHGVILQEIDIDFASAAHYSMIDATISTLDVNSSMRQVSRIAHQLALLQWRAIYTIPTSESLLIKDVLDKIK